MKFSRYNFLCPYNNCVLLYNTNVNHIIALQNDTCDLLKKSVSNIGDLQVIHPELYGALIDGKFIVADDIDEYESVRDELILQSENRESVHLTVNPTMDCNFRCWYCYERHNRGSMMNMDTLSAVKKLITKVVSVDETRKLVLSFFGGEPLMYFRKIIQPILSHAKEECGKHKTVLNVNFTTNAYLLTQYVVEQLKGYGFVSLQIPVDGNEEFHNSVKFLKNGVGTFDRVIENTFRAIEAGLEVTVRCNYTAANIDSYEDLAEIFDRYRDSPNLDFSFHKVWQEKNTSELADKVGSLAETLRGKGFQVQTESFGRGLCYADYRHNAVINYNGDVFKCTAREFSPENRLGVLSDNGEIIWNETFEQRLSSRFNSEICRNCMLFPLCAHGCSQTAFENWNSMECVYGYSESDISRIIGERIENVLEE